MADPTPAGRLDRHALVMAIWTPIVLIAAALLHKGVADGSGWWIAAGFAAIVAGFVCHLVVNAVLRTGFTYGETALGMVALAAALAALLIGALAGEGEVVEPIFLPVGAGLATLVLAVVLYLLVTLGPRGALERFDVIRDNNARASSKLSHRGGRR